MPGWAVPRSPAGASEARGSAREQNLEEPLLPLALKPGEYGFYRWQHVAINLWASQPTAAAIAVLSELTERSLSDCPRGIASIHWLEEGVPLPSPEARVGLSELAKRYEQHVLCVGVLLQGSGFWASATRSALTGVMLLAPRTFFLRFFSEADELSAYVVRELSRRGRAISEAERLVSMFDEALGDFHGRQRR
jgi:hypothetical protein